MSRTVVLSATVVLALVVACMVASVIAVMKPAEAAFPGRNGKIAFTSLTSLRTGDYWKIFGMNPNGSGVQRLTVDRQLPNPIDITPAWSPDGTRIAFSRDNDIYSMNADGSNMTQLTNNSDFMYRDSNPTWSPDGSRIAYEGRLPIGTGGVTIPQIFLMDADGSDQVPLLAENSSSEYYHQLNPAWSPDGSKIAFTRSGVGGEQIYTVNVDGTGLTRLTGASGGDSDKHYLRRDPAWSPDGSKILFARRGHCDATSCTPQSAQFDIWVMNADGSGKKRLTNNLVWDYYPAWSPDGTRIVFTSERDGDEDIWRMSRNGSNQTKLTFNTVADREPDWQPLP